MINDKFDFKVTISLIFLTNILIKHLFIFHTLGKVKLSNDYKIPAGIVPFEIVQNIVRALKSARSKFYRYLK